MKILQRVPLDAAGYSYGYIEFSKEYDSPEEAIAENARLVTMAGSKGLKVAEWAKVRDKILKGGTLIEDEYISLNKYQLQWWKDTKNSLKKYGETQEIHHSLKDKEN